MQTKAKKAHSGRKLKDRAGVYVRLSESVRNRLDRAREQTKRGLSDYVELALERQLEADGIQ